MSRRGEDARARTRRQRAAVARRSETARFAASEPTTWAGAWEPKAPPFQPSTTEQPAFAPAVSAPATPIPTRRPRRRRTGLDLTRLEALVSEREAAAVAVDAEVRRLRRLGVSWPQIAVALGVSRQAARQRYGP